MFPFEGRWAEIIGESNDKGPFKLLRVRSEGHEFDCIVMDPYGLQSSPIKDGQAWILPFNGDNGQAIAFVLPPPAKRVDQQKPGEVSLKNHVTGNRRYMDNDGDTREATKRHFIVSAEKDAYVTTKGHSVVKAKGNHHIDTDGTCLINCGGPEAPSTSANMLEA